jgi:hypothetical protein
MQKEININKEELQKNIINEIKQNFNEIISNHNELNRKFFENKLSEIDNTL